MRIVSGKDDTGVSSGASVAVVIDPQTVYPENAGAGVEYLYTVIGFGLFADGSKSVLYTTALNPAYVAPAQPAGPSVSASAAAGAVAAQATLAAGQQVVGTTDPVSFIQLAGIGTQ